MHDFTETPPLSLQGGSGGLEMACLWTDREKEQQQRGGPWVPLTLWGWG